MALSAHSPIPVPPAYQAIAEAEGVPAELLFALALQESGTRLVSGEVMPWPWTLNIGGRPQRYASRAEAHAALVAAIERGDWVDVGLGQVSWRYHAAVLGDPWSAVDPLFNLQVAARLLRQAYLTGEHRDWWGAVGRYHAPGHKAEQRARAERYRRAVREHHRRRFGDQGGAGTVGGAR